MIDRYTRKAMRTLWEDDNRFHIWLEIECHALDAMAELGSVPKEVAQAVRARATFSTERILEIERELKHDVLAFLTNVSESVGVEARFLHQGMTSSDVLDSCFNIQLTRAADILLEDCQTLCTTLLGLAEEYKHTICVGRSHGIHAEPTTFGLKMLQAWAEFSRATRRLEEARADIATIALSGPVGTFAYLDPKVESYVARQLGMAAEPISTQIIPRDRHAMFFAVLAVIASSIERLSVEIRHLQRSEVLEAEEPFSENQKGSSAMPHKRNPVLTENLTGLARYIRAQALPAMENVALWHERDISHSSVERIIAPDTTIALDFALHRLNQVLSGLVVYPEQMKKNLEQLGGLVHSHGVLLALTQKNVAREKAYLMVQNPAMKIWRLAQRAPDAFLTLLTQDKEIEQHLSAQELKQIFSEENHLSHVDYIFTRTLESGGG